MRYGLRSTSSIPAAPLAALGMILLAMLLAATVAYTLQVRDDLIEHTERDGEHLGKVMAESASRAIETVDVVLDIFVASLRDQDWHRWTPEQGVAMLKEYRTQRHIPQLRDFLVFDSKGDQRFLTAIWPVPNINVADRPYFKAHRDGAESFQFGPYLGRNTGTVTFALTRRITDRHGGFDGVMMASFEPAYFARICRTGRSPALFQAALVNAEGIVVAACSLPDSAMRPAQAVLVDGKLEGRLPLGAGLHHVDGYLISVTELDQRSGLRVLTVASLERPLDAWLSSSMVQWAIATLALLTLALSAIILRKRHSRMARHSARLENVVAIKAAEASEARGVAQSAIEAERQALQELRNFLGMVSHEFRVPLAIIDGASQLLSMLGDRKPEAEEEIAKIQRAVQRMSSLIDTYLSEDRLSTSGLPFRPVAMDLHDLLGATCRNHARLSGGRAVQLSSAGPVPMVADPDLLRIMFDNLIGNALKFSPPDSPVSVAMWGHHGVAEVMISDSGMGIAARDRDRIFEKYFRTSEATKVHGAGLGLFIVRSILDLHEGTIRLDSEPGRGTTFTLSLPLQMGAEAALTEA
jgi:signal transduction histidine kinase